MAGRSDPQSLNITSLTVIESQIDDSNSVDDSGDTQEKARWQQPEEDSDLSFDESFTSNKYAGSFRLRYSTGNASSRRGDTPTTIANSNGEGTEEESIFAGNGIVPGRAAESQSSRRQQSLKAESQELSLQFHDNGTFWHAAIY